MNETPQNRMSRYDKSKEKNKEEEKTKLKQEENKSVEEEPKKFLDSTPKKVILVIILLLISIFIYSQTIGVSIIDTKEYKVESSLLPDSFHGMKIIHFSDLHYGTSINKKQLDRIVNKINKLKPDIIFFTGDLVDKNIVITDTIKSEITDSLSKLNKDTYKYAIYGDEDSKDVYKEMIESSGFTLLDNTSTLLYYKDVTPIMITGFNIKDTNPNYTIITDYIEDLDPTTLYKIVLIHEPDTIDNILNYNPDLVLAGHSLGGKIKIPLIKPLFLPENSKKYYKDSYIINNTNFYISNGLGTTGIKSRLNNHPSINFYRLYKTEVTTQ